MVWFGCFGLIWLHVELKGLLNGPRGLESVLCRGGSECQLRPVRVEGVLEQVCVVVVYHVPIVTIGHGLLKKFWPLILGCVLRTAGSSIIWNYADPLTSLELLNCYLTLANQLYFHTVRPGGLGPFYRVSLSRILIKIHPRIEYAP